MAVNACIRYAYKLKRRDSVAAQEKLVLGCTYPNFRKFRLCVFLKSILVERKPHYLFDLFQLSRSRRNPSLIVPHAIRGVLADSFFVHATTIWNSLPLEVKRNMSKPSFTLSCLSHFSGL